MRRRILKILAIARTVMALPAAAPELATWLPRRLGY